MKHVIFGSGPLGRATLKALLRRGEQVRLVNRSGHLSGLPEPLGPSAGKAQFEIVRADAYDLESAQAVSVGAQVIYNCAAPIYSAHAWETQLPVLWGNILEGAATQQARLVIGDNLYMYDEVGIGSPGQVIHEDLPMHSRTRKGQARIRVTEQMLAAHQTGRVRVTFARASNFFGPHTAEQSVLGRRVFEPVLQGKTAQILGDPDMPTTLTFIEDFGEAMAILAASDSAFGKAWHIPNAPAMTQREVLHLIAQISQQPLRFTALPGWLLPVLSLAAPPLREIREMLPKSQHPYLVSSERFVAAYGDIHTPLETALRLTAQWFAGQLPKQAQAAVRLFA
ncbi:NAD-dependent epimerase/dehydratase family protein [Deinococcus alpinitundrae]|uniref:NAD-dependent epimerase/dehydratase family protein n=1 Tax=Deinococcus alpinitundrae TaxID=468913 RepID=UPI00137A8FF9|nr:NAD-dependent epimerase/dehydratase family protein [Deinococcus alpinitundrae]